MRLNLKITGFLFLSLIGLSTISQQVRSPNGENYPYPFAGGMNSIQFGEIDIDRDGTMDLIAFDRQGDRLMPFINGGTANTIDYSFAPEYISEFPDFSHWVMFRDYNLDGRMDIFSYNPQYPGIIVYRNTSTDELRFELEVYPYLTSWYGSGYVNILVTYADYPGIEDVDNDGDLDILTFWALGSFVEMHKNMSMETYGHADSLIFERTTWCWGEFAESEESNELFLDTCFGSKYLFPDDIPGRERHTGSTFLLTDINNNGNKDLILGDVDYPQLIYLTNDGTPEDAYIGSYTHDFPNGDHPSWIYSMPAAALIDVNNDAKKDLLVSPFDPNPFVTQNHQSVYLYLNKGSNENPDWELRSRSFIQKSMIDVGAGAYPVFADINLDGLQDLIIGNYGYYRESWYDDYMTLHSEYDGAMAIFMNVGEADKPLFEYITDNFGHIREMDVLGPYPAFGDIDSDDDADMIVGRDDGTLLFYRNCSCLGNPEDFQLESENYMDIDVGDFSTPFIFDLDEDGLLDLIIGERGGNLNFYKNTGDQYEPEFTFITDSLGKVLVTDFSISWDGYSTPYFFRGADGQIKLVSGSEHGQVYYYEDIEGNLLGEFTPSGDLWKELDSLEFTTGNAYRNSAAIANINGDDYLDMMTGNFSGGLELYGALDAPAVSMDIPEMIRPSVSELILYPNPAHDIVYIQASGLQELSELKVYDITGRLMSAKQKAGSKYLLDVRKLPEGIYIIRAMDEEGNVASGRVLIRH